MTARPSRFGPPDVDRWAERLRSRSGSRFPDAPVGARRPDVPPAVAPQPGFTDKPEDVYAREEWLDGEPPESAPAAAVRDWTGGKPVPPSPPPPPVKRRRPGPPKPDQVR